MSGNRRSGRKRIPTVLKQLHGTPLRDRVPGGPGDRRVPHDPAREPQGVPGRPEMPAHLADDPLAVAAWERFATTLVDLRVLTKAHGFALGLLAETVADLERVREEWRVMGRKSVLVTEWRDAEGTTRHRIIANPLKRLYRADRVLALQLASEFGLTPASASKVLTHSSNQEGDQFAAFETARPTLVPFKKQA